MMEPVHTTVLLRETVDFLSPRSGCTYADVTAGGGGHTEALLEASAPEGRVVALDRDPEALARVEKRLARFRDRLILVHAPFSELGRVLQERGVEVAGVVADLGLSSPQLDDSDRGFSFSRPGPLDMRMDPTRGETALELIARMGESELADVLYALGEERRSRPIARSIRRAFEAGELTTTEDLRRAVLRSGGPRRGRIDPATRTFQALRLAVNAELQELDALLDSLPEVLVDGGVAAIISFHSLEDRKVKWFFRNDERLEPLSKKPVVPTEEERAANPRSRSAKLRAARRRARGDIMAEAPV
jgi:16S rRNA (cytosine1402-N4)-methyltransferase